MIFAGNIYKDLCRVLKNRCRDLRKDHCRVLEVLEVGNLKVPPQDPHALSYVDIQKSLKIFISFLSGYY